MQHPWNHTKRYNDYSSYIKRLFGERVQKISVDAGFTCPNRDGSKGHGGCSFCNNNTFNPAYSESHLPIIEQINSGINFFKDKYQAQKYLVYFQAYSNTYGDTDFVMRKYMEALSHPLVTGLVIGTRPDCVSDSLLVELKKLSAEYYIAIELGAESTINATLDAINRGHTWEETVATTHRISALNLPVGMHLILGLPGESREQIMSHAGEVSKLPLSYLKLHQLQIVEGSTYESEYASNPGRFQLYQADEFVDLVIDFMELLSPNIIMERFISEAPFELLIAPQWGIKNFEFVHKVEKRIVERNTWQGRLFQNP